MPVPTAELLDACGHRRQYDHAHRERSLIGQVLAGQCEVLSGLSPKSEGVASTVKEWRQREQIEKTLVTPQFIDTSVVSESESVVGNELQPNRKSFNTDEFDRKDMNTSSSEGTRPITSTSSRTVSRRHEDYLMRDDHDMIERKNRIDVIGGIPPIHVLDVDDVECILKHKGLALLPTIDSNDSETLPFHVIKHSESYEHSKEKDSAAEEEKGKQG